MVGPRLEKDRIRLLVAAQRAPEMVGEKRHHGRDHLHAPAERVPQRLQGFRVSVPEAPPGTPDVPVREIVDERHERARRIGGPESVVSILHVCDQLVGAGIEPAVERLRRLGVARPRLEASDVRVVDEELHRVPERQQSAFDLAGRGVAELHSLRRGLLAVHPPHDVRAHARERFLCLDRVAA